MPLLTLAQISLAYGHHALLDQVDLQIEPGERVCLVGRNGTGKSSLLRVISGATVADDGQRWVQDTLRMSYLQQEVPADLDATVYEVVAAGLGELGSLLSQYHAALQATGDHPDELAKLARLQHKIEAADGWNIEQKIESVLTRLALSPDVLVGNCSGGVSRRVMLAQALVSEPDVLLLDEPTNHMDIDAIQWLEEFLLSFRGSLLFITHDRAFLQRLATRIIELDRGKLTTFPGNYQSYLEKKEQWLESQARANAKFDKKLAEEEVWIRQGIKARRTRNEGRVRALQALRRERGQRLDTQGQVSLQVDRGGLSGKIVFEVTDLQFGFSGSPVVAGFSTRIMRGDRIGIIGPNGCGKSTLIQLLLGELTPDQGEVTRGTKLEVAYFDQQRSQLDPDKTVRDNLSDGRDYVQVKGRSRHVISYLKDFLFPAERVDSPVKSLSGGERNRLLLARIFTQSANLLILDEPTNDLDVDTLELLEHLLSEYDGTMILVSHDRAFLDNVVTSTLVFTGNGNLREYVGGYQDYLRQARQVPGGVAEAAPLCRDEPRVASPIVQKKIKRKLGYKEQRELDQLPTTIELLEQQHQQLSAQINAPSFYQQDTTAVNEQLAEFKAAEDALQLAYARWEALEEKSNQVKKQ